MGALTLKWIVTGVVCIILIICYYITKYIRSLKNQKNLDDTFINNPPPRFYITGDKHRGFDSVRRFCEMTGTTKEDVLIVLGDTGFNYYDDKRDDKLKAEAAAFPITLFCLHGNKENRPQNVGTYGIRNFYGGKVYYEPRYPNILFAIDGEVYRFNGKEYLVMGGAHSVDKNRCLAENKPYWDDEMPDELSKKRAERALMERNGKIYGILTHTCPLKYLPTEMFMSTRQNAEKKRKPRRKRKKEYKLDIDRSTEEWLDEIEEKTDYAIWYCGHYHVDKSIDNVHMLHRKIRLLGLVKGADAV